MHQYIHHNRKKREYRKELVKPQFKRRQMEEVSRKNVGKYKTD